MDGQERFVAGVPRNRRFGGATEFPALRLARELATVQAEHLDPEPARPRVAPRLPEPGPGYEASRCVLLTRDVELAQALALIAVGAGVQLVQCREVAQAIEYRDAVVLVGHDCAGEGAHAFPGVPVVLTGVEEHQDVLWRAAARVPGARVAVLPHGAAWLGEYLGEMGLRAGAACITLLAGGCGGAGTSTLAALLAANHVLEGQRTLLLDADRQSTGLWPVLRAREPEGIGWEDLQHSRGALAPGQLAEILPLAQGSAVLSWVREPACFVPDESLVVGVLAASRRIYDRIVIDAGRMPGVLPGVLGLSDERLLVMPVRCALNKSMRLDPRENWSAVFTGTLPSGTDTRALAAALDMDLCGYLPRLKVIERSAGEGRLMSVLARTALRRRIAALETTGPLRAGRAA